MSGLAAGREKRSNAGSKMSSLLEAEEEDEFYTTTYGGFNEVNIYIRDEINNVYRLYNTNVCFVMLK
jgi:hypothetical protein